MSALDTAELLHLAVLDARRGQHDAAIEKLKACIEARPGDPWAYHLLAAEHAEIGMMDRAIDEMRHAVALAPEFPIAHFQLGLLHYAARDLTGAQAAWAALDGFPESPYLLAFRSGLLHLGRGEELEAIKHLDQGLSMPFDNAALRKDMTGMRDTLCAKHQVTTGSNPMEKASGALIDRTYRSPLDEEETP